MKKFEFRLDAVLRFYEVQLELEKTKLSRMLAEEQEILNIISKRAKEVRQQNEAIRELIELRSSDLRSLSSYNLSAQAQNIAFQEKLTRVRRAIDVQRQSVLRAERKTKLLVKLRDRKRFEWQHNTERRMEIDSQEIWRAMDHAIKVQHNLDRKKFAADGFK